MEACVKGQLDVEKPSGAQKPKEVLLPANDYFANQLGKTDSDVSWAMLLDGLRKWSAFLFPCASLPKW